MSAITAKASRKMKKYAVLTREPRCFLGSFVFSWEQRKLGEMGQTYTGLSGKTKDDFGHGQARFVTYMNVFSNPISNPEMTEPIEIDPKQNEVEVGDVFFTTSSETPEEVGMSSILLEKRGKTYLNSFCFGFRPSEKIDSYYLAYMLRSESARAKITLLAQGISRYNISKNKVMEIAVSLPSLDEQKMIGQYFSQLNNLIILHQRKCALLFCPFQALISMMFTTSTFSWEQRKLGELVDVCSGRDYKHLLEGTIPVYGTGGYMLSVNDALSYDRDAIGIGRKGTIDRPYILKAPFWTVDTLFYAIPREKVDLNYAFDTFQNIDWKKKDESTGVPSLSKTAINDIDVLAPKHDEQQIIGQFFAAIDNLITLHQRKCISFTGRAGRLISTVNIKRITSSWEQRKLGDMMNVTSVKRIHQSDWTDSGVRFLRARDIVAAAKNEEPDDYLYISKEKYEEYSALSGKVGVSDLLVTGVGTIGVPYLVRNLEPLYFKDGNIIWFQNSDKIDGKFLFYSFSAEQIQGFINESAGIGTVGTYTIESGKKTPISLPNQIEQAKVGEFFQQLDNLITLHQRKPFLMKWRTSDANRNQTNRLVL